MGSIYDLPFLQNVVLTELVRDMMVEGGLRGGELLPDKDIFSRKTEWDVVFGARTIAPIVSQDTASPLINVAGSERVGAEAVDIREKYALSENDVLFLRMPGTREERQGKEQIADRIAEMRNHVLARKEKMIWDPFLSGATTYAATVDGEALAMTIDYRINGAQFVATATDSDVWTNPGTANPKADFKAARKLVREATGRRVKTAWMNSNTHDLLDAMSGLHSDFRSQVSAPSDLVKNEHITDIIHNIRIIDYDEGHFGDTIGGNGINGGPGGGTFEYFLPDDTVIFQVAQNGMDSGERLGDFALSPSYLSDESIVQGLFAERFTTFDPSRTYLRVGLVGVPRIYHGDWFVNLDTSS